MRQFRLIIIYPQLNASFMRRVIAIAESSQTSIEFFPDFSGLQAKNPTLEHATIVLPKVYYAPEVKAYGIANEIRVVAWEPDITWDGQSDVQDVWHCSGDPFASTHFQTAVGLMTRESSHAQWIGQHKWGALTHKISLNSAGSHQEFKAILERLKLTNHPSIRLWDDISQRLLKVTGSYKSRAISLTCDGNKLKLHYTLGTIESDDLHSLVLAAKKLQDAIVRFEIVGQTLLICCEMNLGFSGPRMPAIILVGYSSETDTTAQKDQDSLEDAG